MSKTTAAKAQFAADLTHPAVAHVWSCGVGLSSMLPTSMLVEAAATVVHVAASPSTGGHTNLQGVVIPSSMILGSQAAPAAGADGKTCCACGA